MANRKWFEGKISNVSGKLFCFATSPNEALNLIKRAARKILGLADGAFINQPTIREADGNAVPSHSAKNNQSYVIDGRRERITLFH